VIENVLLDTGSASTLLSVDAVAEIGIGPEPTDPIHRIRGVGGTEFVFEKHIDEVTLGSLVLKDCKVELGMLDYGFDINGILGLDFLSATQAIIDLGSLECRGA
jgi:predicted aspartyl protease